MIYWGRGAVRVKMGTFTLMPWSHEDLVWGEKDFTNTLFSYFLESEWPENSWGTQLIIIICKVGINMDHNHGK